MAEHTIGNDISLHCDTIRCDAVRCNATGEKELLVVSFGTTFADSRLKDIGGIESALQKAYPEWSVRRAFTSQMIINHMAKKDGQIVDNMQQALERAVENGVKQMIVQPTHLLQGIEYDEMAEKVKAYADRFAFIRIAEPLLGKISTDATAINAAQEDVAKIVVKEMLQTAGYRNLEEAESAGAGLVLMGHGTAHAAQVSYSQMQTQMERLGYRNVFIGTVEGEPQDTCCEAVIEKVKEAQYRKIIIRPLMVVAGDHANHDMAGDDEDSWKNQFLADGFFESVDTQIVGLGRIKAIQDIYIRHTRKALETIS